MKLLFLSWKVKKAAKGIIMKNSSISAAAGRIKDQFSGAKLNEFKINDFLEQRELWSSTKSKITLNFICKTTFTKTNKTPIISSTVSYCTVETHSVHMKSDTWQTKHVKLIFNYKSICVLFFFGVYHNISYKVIYLCKYAPYKYSPL